MNFASKFGYNYGFDRSSSEEMSDEEETTKKKIKRRIRKADTNFISVQFQKLVIPNQMHAGDPLKCSNCEAFVSHLSRINFNKNPILWECDFCLTVNDLTKQLVDKNQLPQVDDISYLIEPAPVKKEEVQPTGDKINNPKSTDDNYLTFCIDVSGSMNTDLNSNNKRYKHINNSNNHSNATRLSAVKAACAENLSKLKHEEPKKRVALLTFSDIIKYYGDCTLKRDLPLVNISDGTSQKNIVTKTSFTDKLLNLVRAKSSYSSNNVIHKNILDDYEKLLEIGKNQQGNLKAIENSHESLEHKIKHLETEGSTALGPALAFSVGFLSNKPGSQIILCTDGCANAGVGSLGYSYSSKSNNDDEKFYNDVASYAYSKSITINVISIEGTDCKLAILGKLTDKTNGNLNIVNPENLGEEFKSILDNRIVARNVKAKLYVFEKYIYLRDEKIEEEEVKLMSESKFDDEKRREALDRLKKSVLEKHIGNATLDTQIMFEYGIRRIKNAKIEKSELKSLPFQLQISYTAPDGSKAVRVYTKLQEFTSDRKQAEDCVVDKERIIKNAQLNISNQVLKENILLAKYRSKASHNLMARNQIDAPLAFNEYCSEVQQLSSVGFKAQSMSDKMAKNVYRSKQGKF